MTKNIYNLIAQNSSIPINIQRVIKTYIYVCIKMYSLNILKNVSEMLPIKCFTLPDFHEMAVGISMEFK